MITNKINNQKSQIIISDIHGHYDSLVRLKQQINYDKTKHQLIYLGDYIDRGPQSWKVIELVMQEIKDEEAIALMGNHEKMFLDALSSQSKKNLWFLNSGKATLAQFNLMSDSQRNAILDFVTTLPFYVENENYLLVHAGINPVKTFDQQTDEDFLWIREEFINASALKKATDKTVIFGHTPTILLTDEPVVYFRNDRIGIDTGAAGELYLSALMLETLTAHRTKVY